MKLTKDQVVKLEGLTDTQRADLSALFTEIEERDTQIAGLKKKDADSDTIVAQNKTLTDLNKKQETSIFDLTTKLADALKVKPPVKGETSWLDFSIFKPFIDALHEDETPHSPDA